MTGRLPARPVRHDPSSTAHDKWQPLGSLGVSGVCIMGAPAHAGTYPQDIHKLSTVMEFGSLRRGPRTTAQGPRSFPHTTRALNRWFFRVNLAAWRLKTFSRILLRGPQQG